MLGVDVTFHNFDGGCMTVYLWKCLELKTTRGEFYSKLENIFEKWCKLFVLLYTEFGIGVVFRADDV